MENKNIKIVTNIESLTTSKDLDLEEKINPFLKLIIQEISSILKEDFTLIKFNFNSREVMAISEIHVSYIYDFAIVNKKLSNKDTMSMNSLLIIAGLENFSKSIPDMDLEVNIIGLDSMWKVEINFK